MYPERVASRGAGLHDRGGLGAADRLEPHRAHGDRRPTPGSAAATTTTPRDGDGPHRGLAVARMLAQVTYRSDEVFTERFDRTVLNQLEFSLEPHLRHRGVPRLPRPEAGPALRRQQLPAAEPGHGPARPGPRSRRALPVRCARVRVPGGRGRGPLRRAVPARTSSATSTTACRPQAAHSTMGGHRLAPRPRRVPDRDRAARAPHHGACWSEWPPRPTPRSGHHDHRDTPDPPVTSPSWGSTPGWSRSGRRPQRRRAGAGHLGLVHLRDARPVDEGRRMATVDRGHPVLQPLRQPDGQQLRGGHRRARGGRGGPGVRLGDGGGRRGGARAVLHRATTSSPSASSTPARRCCSSPCAPAWAST